MRSLKKNHFWKFGLATHLGGVRVARSELQRRKASRAQRATACLAAAASAAEISEEINPKSLEARVESAIVDTSQANFRRPQNKDHTLNSHVGASVHQLGAVIFSF